ncbi:hypothetical protein [Marinobacter nauticus]|uniref:hypothetical protein n=1 Tax=Marinobacter nauticus TaxID=2743 RepID=UPI001C9950EB|nr:hypothetical protein [Marinobacter nauticus]MBY5961939.1 hypothetical protein [Marinobacter nauticus]
MNVELKPIAESKVRQLGGDVCGVLVRTEDGVMAVSEHGRCTRLDAGVMGPVEPAGMNERELFEQRFPVPAGIYWNDISEQYDALPGAAGFDDVEIYHGQWMGWQAARAQGGQGADAVKWSDPAVDPIVSKLYRKFKEWNRQGFGADDVTWCEVRGYVAELLNTHPQPAVPEGWRECLQEMVQAMYDYEMSVEEDAPYKHRAMMDRAHALLSTPTTPQADGPRIDHECELCGHKWSSNDLMDDCVVCTKPAGQEGSGDE